MKTKSKLDDLYNPSENDLMLDEHQGKDRPVIYLDQAKQAFSEELDELEGKLPKIITKDREIKSSKYGLLKIYVGGTAAKAFNQDVEESVSAIKEIKKGLNSEAN